MNPSNQMKSNEEIIEEFEKKFFRESPKSLSNPIGGKHFYGHLREFKNDLLKALQAKDEQAKREKIELPKPYAFGIVQADGQDFSQEDKGNVYMVFEKEELEKVKKMLKLTP